MLIGDRRQNITGAFGVAQVGGMNTDMKQVAENIHHNVQFVPFHFFAAINAAFFAGILGFYALCVDDTVTGLGAALLFDDGKPLAGLSIFPRRPVCSIC